MYDLPNQIFGKKTNLYTATIFALKPPRSIFIFTKFCGNCNIDRFEIVFLFILQRIQRQQKGMWTNGKVDSWERTEKDGLINIAKIPKKMV
jgi:hypothetical protein